MKPPEFWKNDPAQVGLWPKVLAPLSKIWQWAGNYRWDQGAHIKLGIPVICVGNVNLGGTGKTPVVIELALRLIAMGKTPHIVSKGYKGQMKGPVHVNPIHHNANDVGDEPLLLAAFADTWISKDRLSGAKAAKTAGADVIILDDGLQNPAIAKDLTILVADVEMGFGNGHIVPSGPLRGPIAQAAERSDILLTIGPKGSRHNQLVEKWVEIAHLAHVTATIEPLQTGMEWKGLRALAFAGIGRPEKFFKTLKQMGVKLKATRSFDDHQTISTALLSRLENEAWELGAQLVTTEKDAVRLPKEWQQKVLTVPVRLKIHNADSLGKALRGLFSAP